MNRKKLMNRIFLASIMLAIPATTLSIIPQSETSMAGTASLSSYQENVSITNSSFGDISSTYSSNDVTGWSRIRANGSAKTMIIDSGDTFDTYKKGTYYLSCDNPGKSGADNKILMINSANSSSDDINKACHEGYKSSTISLDANSYYKIQVAVKTDSFNEAKEFASIYISGLKGDVDKSKTSFEEISASVWTNYYFFIKTGKESQSITLDLWLGSESKNSYGVAFFDEVYVEKYSENLFFEKIENNHKDQSTHILNETTKYIVLPGTNKIDTSSLNVDFEDNLAGANLKKWNLVTEETNINGHAKILDVVTGELFTQETGYEFPGNDYSYNNNQALVMWANNGMSAVESSPIQIKKHEYYKITASIKTDLESGALNFSLLETEDVLNNFEFLKAYHPEDPENFKEYAKSNYKIHKLENISSTIDGDNYNNNYSKVVLYVEGNNLYNSNLKLKINLGNNETQATGYAIIDNIEIERISSNDYSTGNNKLSLAQTASDEALVHNGLFNFVTVEDNDSAPLAPAKWTVTSNSEVNVKAGIINTYNDYYSTYSTEAWGSYSNPANTLNAPSTTERSNNIFMFWNGNSSYQNIQNTDTISLSKATYYDLTFDYLSDMNSLKVEVLNDDGVVLYSNSNVKTAGIWKQFKTSIYTGETSHKIYISISYGTNENPVSGCAYIDNIKLVTSTENSYNSVQEKVDLSNLLLNLNPYETVDSTLSKHSAYTGPLESGTDGEGGVTIGNGNTNFKDENDEAIDKNQNLPNNVLVVRAGENSIYSLKSNFNIDVTADTFYSLKFKVLTTYLPDQNDLPSVDADNQEISYQYGLSVELNGFSKVSKIRNNEAWKEYTILFKSTSDQSSTISFSMISDHEGIYGTAYITDIIWEESSEDVYTSAENRSTFGKTLLTSATIEEAGDEDVEENTEDNEETTNSDDINWLLIPSILMSAAVVIAIVGWAIRKIKIGKKGTKKNKQEYDRKITVDKTYLKTQSIKMRDSELNVLNNKIDAIEKDLANLEEEHKQYIQESRSKNNGKITKEIEKQFKLYSTKKKKLNENLQEAKETISNIKTPEYLLSLEKKIEANKIKEQKAEIKAEYKTNKKKK